MPVLVHQKENMDILLRKSQHSDIPFLRRMLYEAVFWRASANKPSFEEGLAYPDVSKSLADWGKRDGDTAVVATINSIPVGASWYRFWTDGDFIRGYIDEITPVLVIGVHRDYRHQGIGTKMIEWLVDYASKHSIQRISLMVSKDNYAMGLYRQQGFLEYADKGDAFIMVREI
jgi:ribosomal protein S18 acetylase RimI-like enzyme